MKFLHKFSLQRKQALIVMLTSGVALLLTCVTFATYDVVTLHRALVRNLSTLAKIVGNNSTAALNFNDQESAVETLSALRAEPNIKAGCIYTKNREVFAVYLRAEDEGQNFPKVVPEDGYYFDGGTLHIFHRIEHKGEFIGTVYVESDLEALYSRLRRYFLIAFCVFVAASLVSLLLSTKLQKLISSPILHLVTMAKAVARDKNYSLRAIKQSDDELGSLVDNFNEMLAQIQLRDGELQKAKDDLELRVEKRTRDLRSSEERFSNAFEHAAIGMAMVGLDGRWLKVNKTLCAMLGYSAEELSRKTFQDLTHPDDLNSDLENVRQILEGEIRFYHMEKRYFHKAGHLVWALLGVSLIRDAHGKPVNFISQIQDITERKRSEELLWRTEELYRRAIGGAGAVPYSYDYKTKTYLFMGEGIEHLIGYAPQEITGALWKQIIRESIMGGEAAGLDKAEAARRVAEGDVRQWRCDMRVVTKAGKSRWISDASVQNLDENGVPTGSMGILQDITERKQAEISAIAFSKLGQNLSSATSMKEAADVIGEVVNVLFGWDAFWLKLYDVEKDEIYSEFIVDTVDGHRVVEQSSAGREPTALYRRILTTGAELILRDNPEAMLLGAVPFGNKSRPSASIMFAPILSAGRAVGIFSAQSYTPKAYTEQDLKTFEILANQCGGAFERIWAEEARRKSESQFRLVWNASADGMRLADRAGNVLTVNEAYCQMVGKTRQELEGQPLSIIHSSENAERVLARHKEQIETNSFKLHLEKEVSLWDGRKIWFELSNSILHLPGQPPLLLSIFRDITQRKQAEAELTTLHTQLLDTSRQAGMAEVATSVLHNVGNVLNSVNVSSSLIREKIKKSKVSNLGKVVTIFDEHAKDLPAFFANDARSRQLPDYLAQLSQHLVCEQQEVLEEVSSLVSNIEHIKEIVTMQQSYAKVSGISEMLQVVDLVEDAVRMNAGGLERHGVRIIREFSKVPPILVEKHKVLQILVNLMRNSKHALDDRGAEDKELRLRIDQPNQNTVRISVSDNGVGIPAENLTRIFAHGFTTRQNGHGFGLHSGALAAKEMGGALLAQSEGIGKGAVFTLELPYQRIDL